MPEKNASPSAATAAVPLIISDDDKAALRDDCLDGLYGVLDDLRRPERLRDPVAVAREGELLRRLLDALDREEIVVPDEEMRELFERLPVYADDPARGRDPEVTRAARRALIHIFGGPGRDRTTASGLPGPRWLPYDEEDCCREVLDLLLGESPESLVFDDLVVALCGDFENEQEKNALTEAIHSLVTRGLARQDGEELAPTPAARQMADLGFSIG